MRAFTALGMLAGLACAAAGAGVTFGCSRTPPEPLPAASTSTPVTAASPTTEAKPSPTTASATAWNGGAGGAGTGSSGATGSAPSTSEKAPRCIAATPSAAPKIPPPASSAACPPDPEPHDASTTAMVGFPDLPGSPHIDVELATTGHDIERGLMYRRSMGEEHGMLFRLGERRDHTFWMHNTCISLDMLFVDDDGLIVGIVEGAEPLTDTTRSVGCPSSYVLEVNGGWTRRHGVKAGQHLGIPAVAR